MIIEIITSLSHLHISGESLKQHIQETEYTNHLIEYGNLNPFQFSEKVC